MYRYSNNGWNFSASLLINYLFSLFNIAISIAFFLVLSMPTYGHQTTQTDEVAGSLSGWLSIYWEGDSKLSKVLLEDIELGTNTAFDFFEEYMKNDQTSTAFTGNTNESNSAHQSLLQLIQLLSDDIDCRGNVALKPQINSLRTTVLNDIAMLSDLEKRADRLSDYSLHYRLASIKMAYLSIKLKHYTRLLQFRKISQIELSHFADMISTYLLKVYSSGLVNAYRKNRLTEKYHLIEDLLGYLSTLPNSPETRHLIEKALLASRAGELNNNQRLLSSDGNKKSIASSLLKAIEPLEIALQNIANNDLVRLMTIIKKRDLLRDKYLKMLDGSVPQKVERLWFSEKSDQTLMIFFEGSSKTFEYVSDVQDYQLIVHDKNELQRQASWVIEQLADAPIQLRGNQESLKFLRRGLNNLYQKIFAPISIPLSSKLVIDPDGMIGQLPMAALVDNSGEYLLDRIITLYQKPRDLSSDLLVVTPTFSWLQGNFTDPMLDLQGTQTEIDYIKAHFGVIKNGNDFNALTNDAAPIVHIATHQVISNNLEPALLMGDTDSVFRADFYRFNTVPASMILSACSSLSGQWVSGEGAMSFGSRALEIGAKNLIASLWDVEDYHTAELMTHYLSELRKEQGSATSLQKAKKQLLGQADAFYSHPFFWSPIVHLGQEIVLEQKRIPFSMFLLLLPLVLLNLKIRVSY